MGFYNNTTKIADENGVAIPTFSTAGRPVNPANGQVIYNTDTGVMEIYDTGLWKDAASAASGGQFLYRQIITTGYVMGGYQSTSPWKNVNRMNHATDVMTNLGDLLTNAGAYTSGVSNLSKGFLWSADNTWPGTSATTTAFYLATETNAGLNSNWNMTVGRNDCGTFFKENLYAWIVGGGNTGIDFFNMTTETMAATGQSSMAGDAMQDGVATISDEVKGFAWGNATHKYSFVTGSTMTVNTSGSVSGSGSQQKGISSKLGKGWCGNEGSYNGGNNLRRWNLVSETYSATVGKPVTDSGEENFDMGQDHQYMMGCYTTAGQNNRGWRFSYITESGYELGSGSIRTGVPGGSSGHCVWKG
jgi:hypothetical protein